VRFTNAVAGFAKLSSRNLNRSKKGCNEAIRMDIKESSSIPLILRLVRCANIEASESIPATSKQRFRSMARDLLSDFSAVA
jgi:hypothetical protein